MKDPTLTVSRLSTFPLNLFLVVFNVEMGGGGGVGREAVFLGNLDKRYEKPLPNF